MSLGSLARLLAVSELAMGQVAMEATQCHISAKIPGGSARVGTALGVQSPVEQHVPHSA